LITARLGFADHMKVKGAGEDTGAYLQLLTDAINAVV
jgi:hypothetical protein